MRTDLRLYAIYRTAALMLAVLMISLCGCGAPADDGGTAHSTAGTAESGGETTGADPEAGTSSGADVPGGTDGVGEEQLASYISRTWYFGDGMQRLMRDGYAYSGPGEIDEIVDILTGEPAYYAVSDRQKSRVTLEPVPGQSDRTEERERYALYSTAGEKLSDFADCRYELAVGELVLMSRDGGKGLYDARSGECRIPDVWYVGRLGGTLFTLSDMSADGSYREIGVLDPDRFTVSLPDLGQAEGSILAVDTPEGVSGEYMIIDELDASGVVAARYLAGADLNILAEYAGDTVLTLPGRDTAAAGDILTVRKGSRETGDYTSEYYQLPGMELIRPYGQYSDGFPEYFDGELAVISDGSMYLQALSGENLAGPFKYIYSPQTTAFGQKRPRAEYFYGFDAADRRIVTIGRDGRILAERAYPSAVDISPTGGYVMVTASEDGGSGVRQYLLDAELQDVLPGTDYDRVRPIYAGRESAQGLFAAMHCREDGPGELTDIVTADGTVLAAGAKQWEIDGDMICYVSDEAYGMIAADGTPIAAYPVATD